MTDLKIEDHPAYVKEWGWLHHKKALQCLPSGTYVITSGEDYVQIYVKVPPGLSVYHRPSGGEIGRSFSPGPRAVAWAFEELVEGKFFEMLDCSVLLTKTYKEALLENSEGAERARAILEEARAAESSSEDSEEEESSANSAGRMLPGSRG